MICPFCFRQIMTVACPWCALRAPSRHFVGQDTTAATDAAVQPASSVTTTTTPVSTASDYKAASWSDLELLYPPLWIPWIGGKIAENLFDPSSVADPAEKRKMLAAVAKQLNTVIETCTALPATDRSGWLTFAQSFIPWFNKDVGMLDAKADAEQGDAFQDTLRDWQIEVSKYCNIGMPLLPKSAPTLSQLGQQTLETAGKYFDTVKTVVVVGVVGVILVMLIIGKGNVQRAFAKVVR